MYVCTYIYIYIHTKCHYYFVRYVPTNPKKCFWICSYIQKMILNLIESLKITIYSTQHTQNTQIHFQKSNFIQTFSIFKKTKKHSNHRVPLICMARLETIV